MDNSVHNANPKCIEDVAVDFEDVYQQWEIDNNKVLKMSVCAVSDFCFKCCFSIPSLKMRDCMFLPFQTGLCSVSGNCLLA